MFILILLLLLLTVYVSSNSKIENNIKVGYFAVIGIILVLYIISKFL